MSSTSSSPEHRLEAVSLTESHTSLGLFATAVAGEPLPIEPCDPDDVWPFAAGNPFDLVAPMPSRGLAASAALARRQLRAVALHHAAGVALRSGPVDRRALAAEHLMLPTVFAWLEDRRVDAALARTHPGARSDLDAARRAGREAAAAKPDTAISAIALRCLGGPVTDGGFGDELERAARRVERPGASDADSLRAARLVCAWLSPSGDLVDVGPIATDTEGVETATSGSVPAEGAIDRAEESAGLLGGQPADEVALVASAESEEKAHGLGVEVPRPSETKASRARTFVYDEWDFRQGSYLPAWCRVVERRLEDSPSSAHVDPHAFIEDVRQRHADLRRDIRSELERIRPRSLARVHRQVDGDDLDFDTAIELIADRRSGAAIDERVHTRRERRRRDIATAFLIDLSASTSSPVEPPEPPSLDDDDDDPWASVWAAPAPGPPPRRVIDVAIDAVALMSDALSDLGDPHAIYGFSGNGRHDVVFEVAKEFDDPVGTRSWSATAAMRPMRYTRMGAAIRHAGAKLAATTAATRTLIVLSDGYPQDTDYGEDPRDREHGLHDTARAVAETRNRGLEVFCLTIDPAGHDYLRLLFAEDQYVVIDDIEALPEALARAYLGLAG